MIKKYAVILIVILFTSNCGFTPVYLNEGIKKISIEQIKLSGDRTLNNYLKSNLNKYRNKESTKKISLEVISYYQKNILSKDSSGNTNKYELVTEVIFTINPYDQRLSFKQNKIMENMANKSDERKFEISTKQTFANTIVNELMDKLAKM